MSAAAVVGGVVARLQYLKTIMGETDQVLSSGEQLISLLEIVNGAEDEERREAGVPLNEIVQLSFEIEDILESIALDAMAEPAGIMGTIRSFLSCRGIIPDINGRNLENTLQRAKKLVDSIKLYREFAIWVKTPPGEESDGGETIQRSGPSLILGLDVERHRIFGMGGEIDELVKVLLNRPSKDKNGVVSILGITGLGKTALALALYKHQAVRTHFERFAWVYVPKTFQTRHILADILSQLCPEKKRHAPPKQEMELAKELCSVQKDKKCLVVLDNITSIPAWKSLRIAFPLKEECGSRILLTARVNVEDEVVNHNKQSLGEKESLELYSDTLNYEVIEESEREMVKRCRGIPLAIIMLANIVKHTRLSAWTTMPINIDEKSPKNDELKPILISSYNFLPPKLKPGFLYLRLVPEDVEVTSDFLNLMWIAEGLIGRGERGGVVEYLKDLAQRDMIHLRPAENTCLPLHGLMRDCCLEIGGKEEFFSILDFPASFGSKGTLSGKNRLAVHFHKEADGEELHFIDAECVKKLRSLIFFAKRGFPDGFTWPWRAADLGDARLLRVLHFGGIRFRRGELPRGFRKLAFLRYLSFRGCYLDVLPAAEFASPFLLILDLRVMPTNKIIIPNVMSKLKRLTHLYLPLAFQTDDGRELVLDGLELLEVLENFDIRKCRVSDLEKMAKLNYLAAIGDGNLEELEKLIKYIKEIKYGEAEAESNNEERGSSSSLCELHLDIRNFDCNSSERNDAWKEMLKCKVLRSFSAEGYVRELPQFENVSQQLTQVVLSSTELGRYDDKTSKTDPMPVFGKLPNLTLFTMRKDAFAGTKMTFPKETFPRLQALKLSNLCRLVELIVEEGAMPNLTTVVIENCRNLKKLNLDPQNRPRLSTFDVENCRKLTELDEKLKGIVTIKGVKPDEQGASPEARPMIQMMAPPPEQSL